MVTLKKMLLEYMDQMQWSATCHVALTPARTLANEHAGGAPSAGLVLGRVGLGVEGANGLGRLGRLGQDQG